MPFSRKRVALALATSRGVVAWMGSSPSSLKFVFLAQPSDVVLSVIDKAQSSNRRRFSKMSIQGVMIEAICSSRLFEALKRR
jgi:hypothetical protein